MTVLAYCERVQLRLAVVNLFPHLAAAHREDRVRASRAVTLALEGDDDDALELAESIAKRWMLDP